MNRSANPDAHDPDGWSEFLSESEQAADSQASPVQDFPPEDAPGNESLGSAASSALIATGIVTPDEARQAASPLEALSPPTGAEVGETISAVEESISLDEIVMRQVPVHWPEAVAAIEELCELLLKTGDTSGVPATRDVLVTASGRVMVAPGARRTGDVSLLNSALEALLPASVTPLALRLFVTSFGSSPRYHSLKRYLEALSHYASAGESRPALIQALWRRSRGFPPGRAIATRPTVEKASSRPGRGVAAVRQRWVTAAAVGSLVLGAGVGVSVWLATRRPVAARVATAPASTPVESSTPGDVPAVTPASVPPVAPKRAGTASESGARRDVPAAAGSRTSEPPLQALPLGASSIGGSRLPIATDHPAGTVQRDTAVSDTGETPALPIPDPVASVGASPDSKFYSREDRDVEPPVLRSPGPPTPPGLADHVSNTLELLIDEEGSVLSAKWAFPTQRLSDALVPSAAKNMKFKPAVRNGKAVRYRLLMTLSTPPR